MFSVVRITTGMTISASAIDAGPAGRAARRHDDQLVDEQADHERRRRQQDVVDEARDAAEPALLRRTRPGRCRRRCRSACRSAWRRRPSRASRRSRWRGRRRRTCAAGVDSVNSARFRPPPPRRMVSNRIQTSQNTPNAIAAKGERQGDGVDALAARVHAPGARCARHRGGRRRPSLMSRSLAACCRRISSIFESDSTMKVMTNSTSARYSSDGAVQALPASANSLASTEVMVLAALNSVSCAQLALVADDEGHGHRLAERAAQAQHDAADDAGLGVTAARPCRRLPRWSSRGRRPIP